MKINITLIGLAVFLLTACGGQKKQSQETQTTLPTESMQKTKSESKQDAMANHPGKKVYNSVCLACHMADGSGVPGMHPPLIKTDYVNGDKERLIKLVLKGTSGKLEVDGETYNSVMPPQSHLTDQQIADVLTYVRKSFGNNASEVTKEEVQKVRNTQ